MEGFILTHYLYPLEAPIVLSTKLGITLGNLKDEAEINSLCEYIEISMASEQPNYPDAPHKLRIPIDGPEEILTIRSGLKEFIERNSSNEYINKFFKENHTTNEWKLLAKMWVVVKYDYSESPPLFKTILAKESNKIFSSGYDNIFQETAINYSYILSLLIDSQSFIRPELSDYYYYPEPNVILNSVIFFFSGIHIKDYKPKGDEIEFDFNFMKDKLINVSYQIDNMLDLSSAQKILYIGNLLKVIDERHTDIRLKFTTLVSIIELLLTHNPDFNRFNVEDSISKQFRLKTAILIYMDDKLSDLEQIKKNLQIIYNQRSNIAHGNFGEFQKFVQRGSEHENFPMENFHALTDELYKYIQIVVSHYIKDSKFVDFLKYN